MLKVSSKLEKALAKIRGYVMSKKERWEQRISFAYGNLPKESTSTKADVRRSAEKMLGEKD